MLRIQSAYASIPLTALALIILSITISGIKNPAYASKSPDLPSYTKSLNYDNNSFTLDKTNIKLLKIANNIATLNAISNKSGAATIWSKPIQQLHGLSPLGINYIEGRIRVLQDDNPDDNHAGIVWNDGHKVWYTFLRPYSISLWNSVSKEFAQIRLPITTIEPPRGEGVWYTLKIAFLKYITNIYLDDELKLQIPNSAANYPTISRVGIRSYNTITDFDPIKIGFVNLNLTNSITLHINDTNLKSEVVSEGLKQPTSMAFLGPNDILVLEKDGTVRRVVNGTLLRDPLLTVGVDNGGERGLLGVAVAKQKNGITYVFLYYTQSATGKLTTHQISLGNRLYRYELIDNKLVKPRLLLNLPANGDKYNVHNGGKLLIGPDQNVYLVTGNLDRTTTLTENNQTGLHPDGMGGILRITQDGKPVGKGILGNTFPINLYYGYGLRNSFGMDFDPLTKQLWDTENGPNFGDEINLVEPGFNSGWPKVQGIWKPIGEDEGPIAKNPERDLVNFGGKGKYHAPQLTWNHCIAPTELTFLNSAKLGKQYENDMFIGDVNNGKIYHFKLNSNRTGLVLRGPLAGKVVYNRSDDNEATFAFNPSLGIVTDLKVGPDGYLYVLAFNQGKIFRIVPKNIQ